MFAEIQNNFIVQSSAFGEMKLSVFLIFLLENILCIKIKIINNIIVLEKIVANCIRLLWPATKYWYG